LVHAIDATTGEPRSIRAQQIIFAGPRFVAARVVDRYRREPPQWLSEFQYSPWVVANLSVSAAPRSRDFPLAWDNVFYESQSLGYVVATHQAEVAVAQGPTVLTWYYPLVGADVRAERQRALSASFEDWRQLVLGDIGSAHRDISKLATRLEVWRWGHGMVRPRPGFMWGGARQEAQRSIDGRIHFAHSDLGGIAVFEEANWHGVQAAEHALAGLKRG
jgi:hypothetical protein